VLTSRLARPLVRGPLAPDRVVRRRLLRAALPLGAVLAVNEAYFRADSLIISLARPFEELGQYALAWRMSELVGTVPAVLGIYVQTAGLRARYGLRALRFALLEAGHLAQNLALVAAATGLELGLIGGFYDDLANDVFGLDGIDRFIVYLLPIGHRPHRT